MQIRLTQLESSQNPYAEPMRHAVAGPPVVMLQYMRPGTEQVTVREVSSDEAAGLTDNMTSFDDLDEARSNSPRSTSGGRTASACFDLPSPETRMHLRDHDNDDALSELSDLSSIEGGLLLDDADAEAEAAAKHAAYVQKMQRARGNVSATAASALPGTSAASDRPHEAAGTAELEAENSYYMRTECLSDLSSAADGVIVGDDVRASAADLSKNSDYVRAMRVARASLVPFPSVEPDLGAGGNASRSGALQDVEQSLVSLSGLSTGGDQPVDAFPEEIDVVRNNAYERTSQPRASLVSLPPAGVNAPPWESAHCNQAFITSLTPGALCNLPALPLLCCCRHL